MLLSRIHETQDDLAGRLQRNQSADTMRSQQLQRLRIEKDKDKVSRQRELDRHREAVEKSHRDEDEHKAKEQNARRTARQRVCECHDFVEKLEKALGM